MNHPHPHPAPRPAEILTSPSFVVAVVVLVVNDWILKAAVGNWWTGKLSDFAGLYAFALFWCALLPRRRTIIVALTGLGFLLWKSPLSGPGIAAWNALGGGLLPVTRVVDYTDWIALAVLVPVARAARTAHEPMRRRWFTVARRAATAGMAMGAAVAFLATSTSPNYHYDFPAGSDYPVNGARAAVRAYFLAHDWDSGKRLGATTDWLDGFGLKVTLQDASPCGTRVTLVGLDAREPDVDLAAVQLKFENEVVTPLQQAFPTCT